MSTTGHDTAEQVLGHIYGEDLHYAIFKDRTIVGRNSAQGIVDLNLNLSSYISRKHLLVSRENNNFYLTCLGKNGIFIDGSFQRSSNAPLLIDEKVTFRFPSTTIELVFDPLTGSEVEGESPIDEPAQQATNRSENNGNQAEHNNPDFPPMPIFSRIQSYNNLPSTYMSAPPSPTGTISAVNSCPGSPRSHRRHNQSSQSDVSKNLQQAASVIQRYSNDSDHQAEKPPYSYAQLIVQAIISSSQQQLTLSEIYAHISSNYPFYKPSEKGWQNSIRHNLSLNRYFIKVPRSQEESGKGSFWRVDTSERKLLDTCWKKRRPNSKSYQNQNASFARSAPASPDRNKTSPPNNSVPEVEQQTFEDPNKLHVLQVTPAARYAQSAPGSPITAGHRGTFSRPEPKFYAMPHLFQQNNAQQQQQVYQHAPAHALKIEASSSNVVVQQKSNMEQASIIASGPVKLAPVSGQDCARINLVSVNTAASQPISTQQVSSNNTPGHISLTPVPLATIQPVHINMSHQGSFPVGSVTPVSIISAQTVPQVVNSTAEEQNKTFKPITMTSATPGIKRPHMGSNDGDANKVLKINRENQ